ncbi:MAG: PilZ domain-containing protein [Candidatus Omnitrophota bacterium]
MTNEHNKYTGIERRQYPRLTASVDIKYSVVPANSLNEIGCTKNISIGGICLIVYEKVEIGSVLFLEFILPDTNDSIKATGNVAWTEEFSISTDAMPRYDVGIEFINIDKDARDKISRYILTIDS